MSGNGKKRSPLVAERRYPAGNGGKKPGPKKKAAKPAARKAPRRKAAPKPARPKGLLGWILLPFRWILRLVWAFSWRIGLITALIIAGFSFYFAAQMPAITDLVDQRTRGSVTMTDLTGEVFAWRGDQFGGMITTDTISPHLRNAVVATEDKRFYRHLGISPRGIASAIRINLREGRGPLSGHGGSTITQQTAKLLCLGVPYDQNAWESEAAYERDCRRTTLWRKAREAVYALGMEIAYTKDEILTIYLNRSYLGAGSRGFEAAAQRYFGVSANQVNPAQAAMLAGLLTAPSTNAPTRNLERAQNRAALVLGLMEDQGYLTASQADDARANPATLSEQAAQQSGGFFADWVMESGPEFFTRDTTEDVIIRTTLDQDIQKAAEEALLTVFDRDVREGSEAQAAIVVMSADGAVRAMVGGRNISATGAFNRATQALRQTGSAFKPFIYATALDLDMSPYALIEDAPTCWQRRGSPEWCPQNYDRQFKGPVTMIQALAESRNIPAILLSEDVGREYVRNVANGFGLQGDLAAGPALALGVSESTLLNMTSAYAGILNGGSAVEPYGLTDLRIQGDPESLMDAQDAGIRERIIRTDAARQLTWMMTKVVEGEGGTGGRARIDGWQIAGKSGTTNSSRDAWFIGFTGDYVTGVWMGYDDNRPLSGVTGGGLPATIWRETMVHVLDGKQPTPLPMTIPQAPPSTGVLESSGGVIADGAILNLLENIISESDALARQ
ncbi:PBP1A family penicillin-binding protein [Cognatiyoonia sp. IB215446]|uniref:transglycosylase domain-containing protein n=1 Tax=Cognatiyoonia sp. IB215446 TaxID=3097355 RepID=UPI002A13E80D|nr:PBP1A family penicillin-binding protein [Cognatiyoonia sp. IB215446]MDX8346635.1 PBP1A family penicillin-binding protein [Cognatiyoonia sp. IB215446]